MDGRGEERGGIDLIITWPAERDGFLAPSSKALVWETV
jgi:hypothetical protein